VAQVRRQERQACLDIGALAIPRDEAMHGKGGAEIVGARPMSRMPWPTWVCRSRRVKAASRRPSEIARPRRVTRRPSDHHRRAAAGPVRLVLRERTAQVGPDGDESRFEEFGIPDGEEMVAEVDVAAAQAKRLACAESRAVQDKSRDGACAAE
jgi:hypothetical protein